MNTDPIHQLKTALQTAGALTDQSLKEIERLSIQNEELRAERNKFKNALYGLVEYPSTGAAWKRAAEYQVERDQLKQQLAQAQAACAEFRDCFFENSGSCECPHCQKIKHALSTDCGKGWLSPDEADAAAMRELINEAIYALSKSYDAVEYPADGTSLQETTAVRLRMHLGSTTAGRSLLERLERYEKALGRLRLTAHEGFDESGSHYSDTCPACKIINEALKGDK